MAGSGKPKEFSPGSKCVKCNETLGLRAIHVGGGLYCHRDCFKCDGCSKPLELRFHEQEGKRYCRKCFQDKFAPKCHECKKALDGAVFVVMLDREYHQNCPKCSKCRKSLAGGQYFPHEDKPYCLECHWQVRLEGEGKGKQPQQKVTPAKK